MNINWKTTAAALVGACLVSGTASAQTNVTMWTFLDPAKTSPREVALAQMITDFEALHPEIKINVEPQDFAQMPSKFYLGHRTGGNPDIVWIDAKNLGGLLSSGAGADLDALITSRWPAGASDDFYVRAGYDAALKDGQRTALPLFHGASVIYYRKDLLAEAGIDPASLKTWDDLAAAATALTVDSDSDGRVDVWGLGMPLAPLKTESTPALIGMLGGDPIFNGCVASYDTETGRRAATYTAELITQLKATPQEALVLNVDDVTDQLIAGRYAIAIGPSLRYATIAANSEFGADNLGILPWPTWDGATSAPMPVSGWWVAAWSKSPNLEAAVQFIEYMTGPEGVTLWAETGGQVPTRASLLESPFFAQPGKAWITTMVDAWSTSSWMEPTECNTRTLQADLNEATARMVLDGVDVSTALKEAEAKFAAAQ